MDIDLNSATGAGPEDLHKLFEQLAAGDEPQPTPEPAPTEAPQAKQDEQQKEQPPAPAEAEPEGVATKDGKHIIPYSVLKSERERASRAEQLAREAQAKIDELTAKLTNGSQEAKQPGDDARTDPVPDMSDEDLAALKEDFPTVHRAVMAAMATAKALEAKLAPVEESVRQREAQHARSEADQVQEAIDAVPKLAHIQANDPGAFALARQFDSVLRDQPQWADKPLSERFAKVVEMVEAAHGAIPVPTAAPTKPSLNAGDLAKAAMAKAEQSAKQDAVPTSLSEFPAGQPVAHSERDAIENMSIQQLAEMSPEKMNALIQSLG